MKLNSKLAIIALTLGGLAGAVGIENQAIANSHRELCDALGVDACDWKLIDEAPAAYKDINQVMDDQRDLVEVRATLRAILNYKGTA